MYIIKDLLKIFKLKRGPVDGSSTSPRKEVYI